MYILFTDVDGVLNSDQYLSTHDQLIIRKMILISSLSMKRTTLRLLPIAKSWIISNHAF